MDSWNTKPTAQLSKTRILRRTFLQPNTEYFQKQQDHATKSFWPKLEICVLILQAEPNLLFFFLL
jgi:hypothetical protein